MVVWFACGLRACCRHLCRDESVDSGSLLICSCVWWSVQPVTVLAAAAAAAATVGVHALFSLDKSAAGANGDENFVFFEQAAGAAAAAHCDCARFVLPGRICS